MQSHKKNDPASKSSRTGLILPGLLAIALLAILFPVPQPAMHVNQPFKVELLLSLFLMVFFATVRRRSRSDGLTVKRDDTLAGIIAGSIGVFVLWSAASALWGTSFGSAAHHTLLWSAYLVFLLIFTSGEWRAANFRFISSTFVFVSLILGVLSLSDYITVVDFTSSEGAIRIRYGKYAELLVTISPLLWAAVLYARKRGQKLFILLCAVLSWLTVMLSLSKGAFISGIIGFALFFVGSAVFGAKHLRKQTAVFAGIWLAVTICTQVFFSFFSAVPSTTNYITGAADQTRSTSAMRVFTWKVAGQMAADHWLVGVGADNFGLAFYKARAVYRQHHPSDPAEEIGEDYLVERAHNEPLQIFAELGAVGLVLFSAPFLIFAFYLLRNLIRRRRFSLMFWAAASGMTAFLVSSQFSSFSFRAAQNGVVFFLVFAVAVRRMPNAHRLPKSMAAVAVFSRPAYLLGWLVILLFATFSFSKVIAEYHMYQAERSQEYTRALEHFRSAVAVDPEYAGAYLSHASRASANEDPALAAEMTRKAINHGLGVTQVYSQLARRQAAAGDSVGAEAAFREALAIYPRSIFLRTEYIVFLENQGRSVAAKEQAAIARSVDLRHANGWYMLIKDSGVAAFYRAQSDPNVAPPAELTPYNGVIQYIDKIPGK